MRARRRKRPAGSWVCDGDMWMVECRVVRISLLSRCVGHCGLTRKECVKR